MNVVTRVPDRNIPNSSALSHAPAGKNRTKNFSLYSWMLG